MNARAKFADLKLTKKQIIWTFRSQSDAQNAYDILFRLEGFVQRNDTNIRELVNFLEDNEAFLLRLNAQDRPTGVQ